jgi:ABC-type lipoprotein release transport system permease subunit
LQPFVDWGVERTDFATLAATALALAAAVLAALAPGLRASRTDPMEALRSE